MKQSTTEESYRNFIKDAVRYLQDSRYIEIQGAKLLIIYKPLINDKFIGEVYSYKKIVEEKFLKKREV